MLMYVATTSRRLPSQPLEPLAQERVLNRTVDGDFLRDTARRQTYRLPPLTGWPAIRSRPMICQQSRSC
jgi:hypothetical protein